MSERRFFAVGDPQTSFDRFLAVLRCNDLLTSADRLQADVTIVSLGDHFDYKPNSFETIEDVSTQGILILEWLASHSPEQTRILLGNHDVCRIMELKFISLPYY